MGSKKKVKIVNLTPHPLDILCGDNKKFRIKPGGKPARVDVHMERVGEIEPAGGDVSIPVFESIVGEIVDLPEPKKGILYIVSTMVATFAKRKDVMSPGSLERDATGHVIGCVGVKKVAQTGV